MASWMCITAEEVNNILGFNSSRKALTYRNLQELDVCINVSKEIGAFFIYEMYKWDISWNQRNDGNGHKTTRDFT